MDQVFRGAAAALLLLLAALLLRDLRRSLSARLGAAFAAGVAAYTLCSVPGFGAEPALWHLPVLVLCLGNPVVLWLLASALFDDGFVLHRWHGAVWLAVVLPGLATTHVIGSESHNLAVSLRGLQSLLTFGFALAAIWRGFASWRDDLVEGRRRMRTGFVVTVSVYAVGIALVELAFRSGRVPLSANLANAAALAALAAVFSFLLLRTGGAAAFGLAGGASSRPPTGKEDAEVRAAAAMEPALLASLRRLMESERAYREEGLAIGGLSARLGVPEYRLRRAINQGLGFRNFSTFVNGYRIEEAKAALADPGQAEVPILTIALDAGFQSLGPFNRAFKSATGETPSKYRRRKLGRRRSV
jgi:AraC-like DNA-binding protein